MTGYSIGPSDAQRIAIHMAIAEPCFTWPLGIASGDFHPPAFRYLVGGLEGRGVIKAHNAKLRPVSGESSAS